MADEETREETQERHRKETLEFERIQAELEEYGAIMQSCIEEAERTMQIWRGREERTASWDNKIFLAMMPALSVALFEKVTGKSIMRDLMLLLTMQNIMPLVHKVIDWNKENFWQQRESDDKGEGAES